ncbi:MAG TPA: hypothetical protein VFU33_07485 [Gaiellaceae bacterium]|nr:hypothetical protein [Gaiellaceae bacterium]
MDSEGIFEQVNDSIRSLATPGPATETWEFICECADVTCHSMVSLTLLEFDELRAASPSRPILATVHDG